MRRLLWSRREWCGLGAKANRLSRAHHTVSHHFVERAHIWVRHPDVIKKLWLEKSWVLCSFLSKVTFAWATHSCTLLGSLFVYHVSLLLYTSLFLKDSIEVLVVELLVIDVFVTSQVLIDLSVWDSWLQVNCIGVAHWLQWIICQQDFCLFRLAFHILESTLSDCLRSLSWPTAFFQAFQLLLEDLIVRKEFVFQLLQLHQIVRSDVARDWFLLHVLERLWFFRLLFQLNDLWDRAWDVLITCRVHLANQLLLLLFPRYLSRLFRHGYSQSLFFVSSYFLETLDSGTCLIPQF